MSGGMKRRVQLAGALVHEPDLIFLDEPTAGIDPLLRQIIWAELERMRDSGRTLVITTQYVGEAERCDDVALIAEGQLLAFAPPDELRRSAFGGETLEVETESIVDAASLAQDDLVNDIVQVGPRTLHVTTSDAATATPSIIEAVERAGGTVAAISEFRPSFDDVFAHLVTRAQEPAGAEMAPEAAA
jgi:ABC-2 type transport system ATP-binding protein